MLLDYVKILKLFKIVVVALIAQTGWTSTSGCYSGSGCARVRRCNWWGSCWFETTAYLRYDDCLNEYQVAGGLGGEGGDGGTGRGYGNESTHYKEIMVHNLLLIMVVTLLKDNQAKLVEQVESGH